MKRGLKQGDLLSPFFLNIIVAGLTTMLHVIVSKGILEGIFVREENIMASLLQFGDETLIFCRLKLDEIKVIMRII